MFAILAPVSQWKNTPLESPLPDNDEFYTDVLLHQHSDVRMAEVCGAEVRAVYEGQVDIHGNPDSSMMLEGGLKDGKVCGVETVVKGIDAANRILQQISGGEFQLIVVEVLRTRQRQRAGHRKTFTQMLDRQGIVQPEPGQVLTIGREAGKIFSYVRPDRTHEAFGNVTSRLTKDERLVRSLRDAAHLPSGEPANDLIAEYTAIAASLGIPGIGDAGIPLPATHMVHGGGAWDAFIADRKGRILSVVPFDYPDAVLAAYRFTENDDNFNVLRERIDKDPLLADHFRKMGYATSAEFTRSDWQLFQEANRMMVRLVIAMGGTTYLDERWHFEFGTMIVDLLGKLVAMDPLHAKFPTSGGPGFTSIMQGAKGTAVWHTAVTEAACMRQGLLTI